jgi:shikimate kinase
MRILLVGVSCVGKTTLGRKLAEKQNYSFIDFDAEVAKRMGQSISRIKKQCFNEYAYHNKVKHTVDRIG